MTYGYVRVSSITQNIDRQIEEMYKLGLNKKNIYIDKQSGKDFNRENYQRLKRKLKKNDLLIVKSIDRLGRNYNMVINEWSYITKVIQANIFVIDFPLLDTRIENNTLINRFISDIVLQILSFVSESERENIKQRQKEGIRIAKEKGIHLGRPKYKLHTEFEYIAKKYLGKEITNKEAANILDMNRGTFLKYVKALKEKLEM